MEVTLITVVAVHLLAVNLAAAGPLVLVWLDWLGGRKKRPEWQAIARRLGWWSIWAGALGMAIGLAALAELLYWPPQSHGSYRWMIQGSVPASRWWFVGAEVLFYFVCMLACVLLWRKLDGRKWVRRLLALAAGTNLLYHFPALFTVLAIMFEQRASYNLDHRIYLKFLLTSNALARVTHVLLASFAVAGLALAWIGALRSQGEASEASTAAALGGRIALGASLLQVPVGLWVLLALPEEQSQLIMSTGAVVVFGAAIVTALGLMHQLAMVGLGDVSRRRLSLATLLMTVVVILMTATLHLARR